MARSSRQSFQEQTKQRKDLLLLFLGTKDFNFAAAGQTLRQTATNAGNRLRLTLSAEAVLIYF